MSFGLLHLLKHGKTLRMTGHSFGSRPPGFSIFSCNPPLKVDRQEMFAMLPILQSLIAEFLSSSTPYVANFHLAFLIRRIWQLGSWCGPCLANVEHL